MFPRRVALILGLALVFGACTFGREAQLRKRASEFYDLKVQGDWKTMYNYLDANTRRRMPRFNYVMMQTVADYVSYRIQELKLDQDTAKLKLEWTYTLIHPAALHVDQGKFAQKERSFSQEDEWVLENGTWNYIYKTPPSPADRTKRSQQVPIASRDFFEFIQSIQDLPVAERKRKVEEWRQQHPELAKSIPTSEPPKP